MVGPFLVGRIFHGAKQIELQRNLTCRIKEGTVLRAFLSTLLVLALIPTLWGQMAAHTVRSMILDPVATKAVIRDSGVYLQMERLLVQEVSAGLRNPENPIPFTEAEVSGLVGRVVPASRLQSLAEQAIDGLYQWFLTESLRPTLVLDLSPIRAELPGAVRAVIQAKVEALPVCSANQAAQLAVTYKGGMPPCKSPDARFNRMVIDSAMPTAEIEQLIPDRLDVAAELEDRQGSAFWEDLNTSLSLARTGLGLIPYGWGVVGVMMLLLLLLNMRTWYSPFGWLAAPLLVAGGLMLVTAWVGVGIVLPILTGATVAGTAGADVAASVAKIALGSLALSLRNLSLLVSLVGLGFLILAVAGSLTGSRPGGTDAQQAS